MPLEAYFFLEAADEALDTTLPFLFLVNLSFVSPPLVRSLVPLKTLDFARVPLATLLTFMAFMAFIAFMPFITFVAFMPFIAADFFIATAFMAGAFITFIGKAIAKQPPTTLAAVAA